MKIFAPAIRNMKMNYIAFEFYQIISEPGKIVRRMQTESEIRFWI